MFGQKTLERSWMWLRFVPLISIGLLLAYTYWLFDTAYFWLDDFNNLYWVQQQTLLQMMGHVVNPVSGFFRPVGMLSYWVLLKLFDLDPLPYHLLAWSIHAANTTLVYLILKQVINARSGAAVGAMLFSCQAVFANIYWSFGTIFELTATLLFFSGILFWMREERSLRHVAIATVLLLFAMKAKEMAVTLPVIWFLCDLSLCSTRTWKRAAWVLLPGIVGLWYGTRKAAEMRGISPTDPYYMDVRSHTLGRGFGGYFDTIFNGNLRWQIWSIAFVVLLLVFLMRSRRAVFFHLYVFVTFLPIIFLINHREPFYWYMPFLGLSGLAALLVQAAVNMVEKRVPVRTVAVLGSCVFVLLCWKTYVVQRDASEATRQWQRGIAAEYRTFISGLRSLPPPGPNETIFFDSVPRHFAATSLQSAVQVAFRRTDVDAKLVSEFPLNASYRLTFEDSHLTRLR